MFIRELIREKKLKLKYVSSEFQKADMFTKPLSRLKFEEFVELLNLKIEGKY